MGNDTMPRVYRQQYTRPIPEGAERMQTAIRRRGKKLLVDAVRFKGEDGKWVVAPLVESGRQAGTHCRVHSPTWYGRVNGQPVPLCANRAASEVMLADLLKRAALVKAGVVDPFEDHRRRPLAEHLDAWEAAMQASGATPRHARQTAACARRVLDACGCVLAADLSASLIQEHLAHLRGSRHDLPPLDPTKQQYRKGELAKALGVSPAAIPPLVKRHRLQATGNGKARRYPRETAQALRALRTRGRSIKTTNLYLDALKSFCAWMVDDRRLPSNPLAHLSGGNVKLDRRHDRRELTADELRHLLATTRASERTFRGLTGEDRYHLYACACGTGFRAGGLAGLTPGRFDLAAGTITLTVRTDKSRRGKVQPMPADLVEVMANYLKDRPPDRPLWPGTWSDCAAEMLRGDLEACGIPYVVPGPNGPLFADFHALRHSYLTALGRAGVDLRTAQELAGHSTPVLTARYMHVGSDQLDAAAQKLAGLIRQEQTGPADDPDGKADSAYTLLTNSIDGECGRVREEEGGGPNEQPPSASCNPLTDQGFAGDGGRLTVSDEAPRVGLEPTTNRLTAGAEKGASTMKDKDLRPDEPGAYTLLTGSAAPDALLSQLLRAWPELPEHIRLSILALLQAAEAARR